MKNIVIMLWVALFVQACSSQTTSSQSEEEVPDQAHNSRNSVDWFGVYVGTLPCADCSGLKTMIRLNQDQTYVLKTRYEGESDSVYTAEGGFDWNEAGSQIKLNGLGESSPTQYMVGENTLIQLDLEGNQITGALAENYILNKAMSSLTNTHWELTELKGETIANSGAFITLSEEDNRYFGSGGCNRMTGTYELQGENQLVLSVAASTRMLCPDIDTPIEDQFFQTLASVSHFKVESENLVFYNTEDDAIAQFRASYFHMND